MRIGCEDWTVLDSRDVAWVTEWQLAAAFPWIPLGEESPVLPDSGPEPSGRCWTVAIRAGLGVTRAHLPVRDLGRVIRWCHQVSERELFRPPASIRASLLALRVALRRSFSRLDPLAVMGYASRLPHDLESGA
jgi:hypothetical protein